MLTFYTAIGSYYIKQDTNGHEYPVVVSRDREVELAPEELILWSGLLWNISHKGELEEYYMRECNALGFISRQPFDYYLERLMLRGIVVSGQNIVGQDALYDMLCNLSIFPCKPSLFNSLRAGIRMLFRRIRLRAIFSVLRPAKLDETQRRIMRVADRRILSVAEMIRVLDSGDIDIEDETAMAQALYGDELDCSDEDICNYSRFSEMKGQVLNAVANLYLQKQVIFDKTS